MLIEFAKITCSTKKKKHNFIFELKSHLNKQFNIALFTVVKVEIKKMENKLKFRATNQMNKLTLD